MRDALDDFDEPAAHAALDQLLSSYSLETVLREALLPYLARASASATSAASR